MMTAQAQNVDVGEISGKLAAVVGDEHVLTDQENLELHSLDFSDQRWATAAIVVRPGSTEEVAEIVKIVSSAGFAIVPRGGGMSYTLGCVPERHNSVIVDMRRMNRIVEINTEDLYITVEPGATWKQLHDALWDNPYHIPFHGTLSGFQATVGGALGNGAVGLGKGEVWDDLIGLEVVLADGRVIQTGGRATSDKTPLLRDYGPDFTGIFINDAGALGIKTKATFRLARKPGGTAYLSFGFQERRGMVTMLCDIGRLGVSSESFGFGRYHHEQFCKEPPPSKKEARELLSRIMQLSSSKWRGLRDILRVVRSGGLKFLQKWEHSVHIVVDGFDQGAADRGAAAIKRIAKRHGGKVLPPTLCIGLRIDPFQPVDHLILGPDGECSTPSHCIVPLSRAYELDAAVEKFFSDNEGFMKEHGLVKSYVYVFAGGMFGIEPILYWRDKLNPLRLSVARVERKEAFSKIPATPATTEAAIELRRRMVVMFKNIRGCHYQIGKFYPYRESVRSEDTWKLLEDMKTLLDPDHLMNPGSLGLQ